MLVTELRTQLYMYLLVVTVISWKNGNSCVDKLPDDEHGLPMFRAKDAKDAEEKAFFGSLNNILVGCLILSFLHTLLAPNLHLHIYICRRQILKVHNSIEHLQLCTLMREL